MIKHVEKWMNEGRGNEWRERKKRMKRNRRKTRSASRARSNSGVLPGKREEERVTGGKGERKGELEVKGGRRRAPAT